MKPMVTIFTPTFNRAHLLQNLYDSLCRQTNKNFLWHIVDDGSTDDTGKLVKQWKKENKEFVINYTRQSNGGKQRAHNVGVQMCETELFFCVDSDDSLVDDAVKIIIENWGIAKQENIAGIVALRGKDETITLGTSMPKVSNLTMLELYQKYHFKGDTALIYRTEILKKYPFVLAEGEKFIGENFVYNQIDLNYKMYVLNKIIYICQYFEDGYTRNTVQLLVKNPHSYMILKKQQAEISLYLRYRIKHMAGFIAMGLTIHETNLVKKSGNLGLAILSYPLGLVIWRLRFKKVYENL
ncbi:hypothetical protein B5E62_15285 [Lachnoclostridium sp. An118]|nr:hypothetical protein B5E62_15285 [Lachnoclostridium sp. An118]